MRIKASLFIVSFNILMIGLVADVISFNRRLIEETLLRVRRIELTHFNFSDNTQPFVQSARRKKHI